MSEKLVREIDGIVSRNNDLDGFYNFMADVSLNTVRVYLLAAERFLEYSKKKANDVKFDDYIKYMNSIRQKTSSYQIMVYSALKKFSKYLKASKKCQEDYMKDIPRPKPHESIETRNKREKGYLTEKEVEYMLDNIRNGEAKHSLKEPEVWIKRDMAIVLVLLNTGMRCSALTSLNVESIDFDERNVRVIDKGSKIRDYYLTEYTINAIKEWLETRNDRVSQGEHALFINKKGNRISSGGVYEIVNKYADFDDKRITPHKLRATFGTRMFEKTGDLYFVQQCMGHSNPKTTELYIRGQDEATRTKAKEILEILY